MLAAAGLPARLCPAAGQTTINAEQLAPVIVDAPARVATAAAGDGARAGTHRPYLMLVGDKTLPTLPARLGAAGRAVTRVPVYATAEAPTLGADLEAFFAALSPPLSVSPPPAPPASVPAPTPAPPPPPLWVAFFSPSSAAYVLPHLEKRARLPRAAAPLPSAADGAHLSPVRFVAIGGTTEKALTDAGYVVAAVAQTPDADGIVEAMLAHDDARTADGIQNAP